MRVPADRLTRFAALITAIAALGVPSVLRGDILYLKGGSEIRGRVVSFAADTLVFAPAFGGRVRVGRGDIARVVFGDSADSGAAVVPATAAPGAQGTGTISLVFQNDKLSSKIRIEKRTKGAEADLIEANRIEQVFVVDADTVYSRVDTTMDKTIYKGHEKEVKNTIRLEDVQAVVPAGVHRCVLVVRNVGAGTFERQFSEGPLDMTLEFPSVEVSAGRTTVLTAGIKKGFLRLGSPRLYPVE